MGRRGAGEVAGGGQLGLREAGGRVGGDGQRRGRLGGDVESNVTRVLPKVPLVQCAAVTRTVGEIKVAEQR